MKLLIAGSRNFQDFKMMEEKLDFYLSANKANEIVSGRAKGADMLGEKYAENRGIQVKVFPADWETHGKRAGYLRNEQMVAYATHAVFFWDSKSPGTRHAIRLFTEAKKPYRIVLF